MAVENEFKESTVTTSNHTINYDLPLWEGDDVTSWLTQVNDAMNKIDTGIYDAKQSSHEVVTIAENAQKLAEETKAESDASAKIVEGYEDRLKSVEDTTAEHTTDLTNLSERVDTQDTEIHSLKEVNETILADVGTLKNSVAQNTTDLETDKASITNLQSGQESLTSDVEELQNEITQVGRVFKKLGSVNVASASGISSSSGNTSMTFSGLSAVVYGNGTVEVTMLGTPTIAVPGTPTQLTETFSLLPLFNQLFAKVKELCENNNLTFSSPSQTLLTTSGSNSAGGGSITATNGFFDVQLTSGRDLLISPALMFTSDGTRITGWQSNATYRLYIPTFTFHAYEEV